MKLKEKHEAIKLRKQGLSIRQITDRLGVAKSSVSVWVRDVELTDQQHAVLTSRYIGPKKAQTKNSEEGQKRRLRYREEGREIFVSSTNGTRDVLIAGAMLYWAEGHKRNNQHTICFSNSDANMLRLFIRFLVVLGLDKNRITLSIQCYDDHHAVRLIEWYWLNKLDLPKSSLRTTQVNRVSSYSRRKRCGKSEWGTARLRVCDVVLLQRIYGIIGEIGGRDTLVWAA